MPKKSTPVRNGVQRSRPKPQKAFELVRPATQEPKVGDVELTNDDRMSIDNQHSEQILNESKASSTNTVATATKAPATEAEETPIATRRSRGRATASSELATLPTTPEKKKDNEESSVTTSSTTKTEAKTPTSSATKGSASERLAARRQGTQRTPQKNAVALVTAEHYSYVRRDLIFIAVLALIMFIIIIVLYFVGV